MQNTYVHMQALHTCPQSIRCGIKPLLITSGQYKGHPLSFAG